MQFIIQYMWNFKIEDEEDSRNLKDSQSHWLFYLVIQIALKWLRTTPIHTHWNSAPWLEVHLTYLVADRSLWSCTRFSLLTGVSRTDFCFSEVIVCRLSSFPFYSILPFYGIPPILDLLWSFPSGLGECSSSFLTKGEGGFTLWSLEIRCVFL